MSSAPSNLSPLDRASAWTYCVRRPSAERKETDTHMVYKKGYEVRFSVKSAAEQRALRRCLADLGFKAGRGYAKRNQIIVPVYGKAAVDLFDR